MVIIVIIDDRIDDGPSKVGKGIFFLFVAGQCRRIDTFFLTAYHRRHERQYFSR